MFLYDSFISAAWARVQKGIYSHYVEAEVLTLNLLAPTTVGARVKP